MKDLLISLDSNILKVSYCGPEGCAGFSQELSADVAKDTLILDTEKFTEQLIEYSSSLLPFKNKPDALSFLVSPQDVFLAFLTVRKSEEPVEEQLVSEAVSKIDVPLENLYFSYIKIAPFVYQFLGIKKDYLDSLIEVSNLWSVPIKSVVPWVLLLPKTLKDSSPAIFVGSLENKHTVVLSELNGVYFASSYDQEKSDKEISDLVKQLSLYNRSTPIEHVYTINTEFTIGGSYQVHPILEDESFFGEPGFESHDLVLKVMKRMPQLMNSQVNMLNLLPLPEIKSKSRALVPVSAAVVLALIVGGYFVFFNKHSLSTENLSPSASEVLSESSDVSEETSLSEVPADSTESPDAKIYTKDDLIIRVENASEVNGAAGRTKDLLENLGYKVESIGTAPNQLELTQILITESLMDLKEELKESLGEDIPMSVVDILDKPMEISEEDSSEDKDNHNVLIRLGKDSSI